MFYLFYSNILIEIYRIEFYICIIELLSIARNIMKYMYNICPFVLLLQKTIHRRARFDLFLYLSMNCMLVTIGTKFFQFQPIGCVASILLSNISRNTPWFLITILSNTTSTFQNNAYSDIFTLGHEPPFYMWIVYSSNSFIFDPKRKERKNRNC